MSVPDDVVRAAAEGVERVTCGGCTSGGAHRRWCPAVVGELSARRARMAEQAEAMADACGVPEAASHLWAAASVLRAEADRLARVYAANARWAGLEVAVRLLAQPHADHPDFDPEWRLS